MAGRLIVVSNRIPTEGATAGGLAVALHDSLSGTGGIWKKVAAKLPQEKQKYGVTVAEFKTAEKQLVLSNGDVIEYKQCIR